MRVSVECPNHHRFRVPEENLGKKARCPRCQEVFILERASTDALDQSTTVSRSEPDDSQVYRIKRVHVVAAIVLVVVAGLLATVLFRTASSLGVFRTSTPVFILQPGQRIVLDRGSPWNLTTGSTVITLDEDRKVNVLIGCVDLPEDDDTQSDPIVVMTDGTERGGKIILGTFYVNAEGSGRSCLFAIDIPGDSSPGRLRIGKAEFECTSVDQDTFLEHFRKTINGK